MHRLDLSGIYMVTGATVHKERFFTTAQKLSLVEAELLTLAKVYKWQLEAWAVFVNQYHFVARGSEGASLLILCSTQLRSPKRCEAWIGPGC
jgi:hypothetical protein